MTAKIEWYREVLELEPNSKVFFPLARLLAEEGQTEESIMLLRKGLERHPEYLEARLCLIEMLFKQGMREACNEEVGKLSKMFASYAGFWQAWAACLASEQDQEDTASIVRLLAAHFVSGPLKLSEVLNRGLDALIREGAPALNEQHARDLVKQTERAAASYEAEANEQAEVMEAVEDSAQTEAKEQAEAMEAVEDSAQTEAKEQAEAMEAVEDSAQTEAKEQAEAMEVVESGAVEIAQEQPGMAEFAAHTDEMLDDLDASLAGNAEDLRVPEPELPTDDDCEEEIEPLTDDDSEEEPELPPAEAFEAALPEESSDSAILPAEEPDAGMLPMTETPEALEAEQPAEALDAQEQALTEEPEGAAALPMEADDPGDLPAEEPLAAMAQPARLETDMAEDEYADDPVLSPEGWATVAAEEAAKAAKRAETELEFSPNAAASAAEIDIEAEPALPQADAALEASELPLVDEQPGTLPMEEVDPTVEPPFVEEPEVGANLESIEPADMDALPEEPQEEVAQDAVAQAEKEMLADLDLPTMDAGATAEENAQPAEAQTAEAVNKPEDKPNVEENPDLAEVDGDFGEEEESFSLRTRSMAEVLAEQGDIQGALDIYQELAAAATSSDEAEDISRRIATLTTRLNMTNASAGFKANDAEAAARSKEKLIGMLEALAERVEARAQG